MTDNKEIEEIINQTFSGLMFFYRDTAIDESLVSKYEPDSIIVERGFTDMAYNIESEKNGLATNLRYLIASAHAKDLSFFSPFAEQFSHAVLPSGTCFKVLDIYRLGDKTQILLLEIPVTAADFFSQVRINLEEIVIAKAREDFDATVNAGLLPELQTQEWRERTEFPIGMNNEGVFYKI
jgi:hypothetical protein